MLNYVPFSTISWPSQFPSYLRGPPSGTAAFWYNKKTDLAITTWVHDGNLYYFGPFYILLLLHDLGGLLYDFAGFLYDFENARLYDAKISAFIWLRMCALVWLRMCAFIWLRMCVRNFRMSCFLRIACTPEFAKVLPFPAFHCFSKFLPVCYFFLVFPGSHDPGGKAFWNMMNSIWSHIWYVYNQ